VIKYSERASFQSQEERDLFCELYILTIGYGSEKLISKFKTQSRETNPQRDFISFLKEFYKSEKKVRGRRSTTYIHSPSGLSL